jgi:hypothetical protein
MSQTDNDTYVNQLLHTIRTTLTSLFEERLFDIDKPCTLLQYRLDYVWPMEKSSNVKMRDIVNNSEFVNIFNQKIQKHMFGLTIYMQVTEPFVSFFYQPAHNHPSTEYLSVCQLFDHLRFYNHSMSFDTIKPCVSISIDGRLYHRPDREYYVVFETSTKYIVHVYEIGPNMKRNKMMFVVCFDTKERTVSEPIFI